MDNSEKYVLESAELPMYVAVAYTSLNIHLAIGEMNALARDGYRLVEKIEVWDKRKPDRHAVPVESNVGYFIMEWMPPQDISIEMSPMGYDPEMFKEDTGEDAAALAAHVFSGSEDEKAELTQQTLLKIDELEDEMDAEWDPDKDRVTTPSRRRTKTEKKKAEEEEK